MDNYKAYKGIQAMSVDEAADPAIPDLFQNKIPASFMGSRAWASDQVLDSLAIARHMGKSSVWQQIRGGQRSSHNYYWARI
jgi:hypothetical protein